MRQYRVGLKGAQVVFGDGSRAEYPAGATVEFSRRPKKIIGTLYPLREDGGLAYEAPSLEPSHRKDPPT